MRSAWVLGTVGREKRILVLILVLGVEVATEKDDIHEQRYAYQAEQRTKRDVKVLLVDHIGKDGPIQS